MDKIQKVRLIYNVFSLAFLVSIPLLSLLSFYLFQALLSLIQESAYDKANLATYLYGLVAAASVLLSSSFEWMKTFIHEMKHVAVIIISGNKLDSIQVSSGTGSVAFRLFKSQKKYAPFILLAPYFFPLFSLPIFIIGLFVFTEITNPIHYIYTILLGLTLGTDLSTAYLEIHPHQSDLQRILGGRLTALIFILVSNLAWFLFVTVWISSGNFGFMRLFTILFS